MKISYDYEDLIKEIQIDLINGDLSMNDKIDVVRERVHYKGQEVYQAIVDYGFDGVGVPFNEMKDGDIKEKMLVKDVLKEMEEMNRLL